MMKQFLKKLLFAAVCCSVLPILYTIFFFVFASDAMSLSYVAAIGDKVERLASIEEPKIILIANSNLAFGIDSETIEEAYDIPVVNMGLHGALGNHLIEQIAKGYISEGDIVVIAHSDYNDSTLSDPTLLFPMMVSNAYVASVIQKNYLLDVIKEAPAYMWEVTLMISRGATLHSDEYSRDCFNEYGDVAYERIGSTVTFTETTSLLVSQEALDRLNEYNVYCENAGATLVIAGFPIGNGEYTPTVDEITEFQNTLQAGLDCQVISDYTDYLIDYEYFYNSILHLNDEGAAIRTAQLIEDLQAVISQE